MIKFTNLHLRLVSVILAEAASPVRLVWPWPDHFSAGRALVSCPDCRDGLRTRRLGQVSQVNSPLLCVYVFLVIVPALLPVDQEPGAARPDCIGTHVLLNTHAYTTCSC